MAIIKCKMCGGELAFQAGSTVAQCDYCGRLQTVPNADSEKKLKLFDRANELRASCEFDKASGIYESIIAEFPREAEAYWGLVLCKYGIEYVDDPGTGQKIPTCHRSSFSAVTDDLDLKKAMENADLLARRVYQEEAQQLEALRQNIVAVSSNERDYDIFICYKETDNHGQRTLDSLLAQDLYDALTGAGYHVFFSRITLEDKLGVQYEPYIFAALNSARIMLAVTTSCQNLEAVWVKNEWSRYLKLMTLDPQRHLIPCYKGIDPASLPAAFAKLQAQDLGKVGAVPDLLRGIGKLLPRETASAAQSGAAIAPEVSALLRRGMLFIDDGEWDKAQSYFEKVLDRVPECAEAYVGHLLAQRHMHTIEQLGQLKKSFANDPNYIKAVRFGDEKLVARLKAALAKAVAAEQQYHQEMKRVAAEREKLEKAKQHQEALQREARLARQREEEKRREERLRAEQAARAERQRIEQAAREEQLRQQREKMLEQQRLEQERRQKAIDRKMAIRKERRHNRKLALVCWILLAIALLVNLVIFFCTTVLSAESVIVVQVYLIIFAMLALEYLFVTLRLRARASGSNKQKLFMFLSLGIGAFTFLTALFSNLTADYAGLYEQSSIAQTVLVITVAVLFLIALFLPFAGRQYQEPENAS